MKRLGLLGLLLLGLIILRSVVVSPVQAQSKCDGFAEHGSTHRNSGNGCKYTCNNGSWSGPKSCDGQGNGQFQGEPAKTAEEKQRQQEAVQQRQKEAEQQIAKQSREETVRAAAETAQQRANEAARQQAMVESQRQAAASRGQSVQEAAAEAQQASQAVAAAAGTSRGSGIVGSGDRRAVEFAASGYDPGLMAEEAFGVGGAGAAAAAQAGVTPANLGGPCNANTGLAGGVGAGGACCRGGISECGSGSNGHCVSTLDRVGVVGVCGAPGTPDTSGFCGDSFCNGATENASNCQQDCRYIQPGQSGGAFYQRQDNKCVACQSASGAGCTSYAACLRGETGAPLAETTNLTPTQEQQLRSLDSLTNRCFQDIDYAEGTLDEECVSDWGRSYRNADQEVRAIVDERREDERQISSLAFSIGQMRANCTDQAVRAGAVCDREALAEATQLYNQAVDNFSEVYGSDRGAQVERNGNNYISAINANSQEQLRLANDANRRYQEYVEQVQRECASSPDPAVCAQRRVSSAVNIFTPYATGSPFCDRYPTAPTCSPLSATRGRVENALSINVLYPLTGRYKASGVSCVACRENLDSASDCRFASEADCRAATVAVEGVTQGSQICPNYYPDGRRVATCGCGPGAGGSTIEPGQLCPTGRTAYISSAVDEPAPEATAQSTCPQTLAGESVQACHCGVGVGIADVSPGESCPTGVIAQPFSLPPVGPAGPVCPETVGSSRVSRCECPSPIAGSRNFVAVGSACADGSTPRPEFFLPAPTTPRRCPFLTESNCELNVGGDCVRGENSCWEAAVTPVASAPEQPVVSVADQTCPYQYDDGRLVGSCGCGAGSGGDRIGPGERCPGGQRAYEASVAQPAFVSDEDRLCPTTYENGRRVATCGCGAGSGGQTIEPGQLCPAGQRAYRSSAVPVTFAPLAASFTAAGQALSTAWTNFLGLVQRSEVVTCPDRPDTAYCLCGAGEGVGRVEPGQSCVSQSGISEVRQQGNFCPDSPGVTHCLCGRDRIGLTDFCPQEQTFEVVTDVGSPTAGIASDTPVEPVGVIDEATPVVIPPPPLPTYCPVGQYVSHCTCREGSNAARRIEAGDACNSGEAVLVVAQTSSGQPNLSGTTLSCTAEAAGQEIRSCVCLATGSASEGQVILPGQSCYGAGITYNPSN